MFNHLGFHSAKVDDIAKEAKLSKGGLYWHFNSKDEILVGILERLLASKKSNLLSLQYAEGSATDRLLSVPSLVVTDLKKIKRCVPLVFEYVAIGLRDEAIQQLVRVYAQTVKESLVPIIKQGIDREEFRPVNPERAAVTVMAVMQGVVLVQAYDPAIVDIEKEVMDGVRLLIQGIAVPEQS